MKHYIVHIYREMRLTYLNVAADTPEAAAAVAADRSTEDADNIEDCNGDNLAALVDLVGDDDFSQSVTIDFGAERTRKAVENARAAVALPTSPGLTPTEIDIHTLLAERRQIAHIWSLEDVQGIRPDLDDDQAWEVLEHVDRHKDAGLGISWLTLEMAVEHLFGDAPETDDAGEA